MHDIAVCIVVNDCYHNLKYCIDNLTYKTKAKIRLHILNNGSTDERLLSYLKQVCEENKWYLKTLEKPVPISKAYNLIIESTYQNYCCLFPINSIVCKNWAEDLLSEYKINPDAGLIGIRNGEEKTFLTPILCKCESSEDYFKNVWFDKNNTIEGVVLFEREKLHKIGLFDERMTALGYEVLEFSFRFSANGFQNYYITKQSAVKVDIDNEITFPTRTQEGLKQLMYEIEIMIKTKHFKK